jgi:hypothetical protein
LEPKKLSVFIILFLFLFPKVVVVVVLSLIVANRLFFFSIGSRFKSLGEQAHTHSETKTLKLLYYHERVYRRNKQFSIAPASRNVIHHINYFFIYFFNILYLYFLKITLLLSLCKVKWLKVGFIPDRSSTVESKKLNYNFFFKIRFYEKFSRFFF